MVADYKHRPASGGVDSRDLLPEFRRREFVDGHEHQIHGHLQFLAAVGAVVVLEFGNILGPGFANQYGVVLVRNFAQPLQYAMDLRQLGVVLAIHVGVAVLIGAGQNGIVLQAGIFEQGVDRIQAET